MYVRLTPQGSNPSVRSCTDMHSLKWVYSAQSDCWAKPHPCSGLNMGSTDTEDSSPYRVWLDEVNFLPDGAVVWICNLNSADNTLGCCWAVVAHNVGASSHSSSTSLVGAQEGMLPYLEDSLPFVPFCIHWVCWRTCFQSFLGHKKWRC